MPNKGQTEICVFGTSKPKGEEEAAEDDDDNENGNPRRTTRHSTPADDEREEEGNPPLHRGRPPAAHPGTAPDRREPAQLRPALARELLHVPRRRPAARRPLPLVRGRTSGPRARRDRRRVSRQTNDLFVFVDYAEGVRGKAKAKGGSGNGVVDGRMLSCTGGQ